MGSSHDIAEGSGGLGGVVHPEPFMHGGELVEEISQIGLEVYQSELRELSSEMLKHLSLRCFNDMRVIFLIHDKRMLGIVLRELESLVHKHGILTEEQAEVLRRGIVPTVLPGSPELGNYYSQCLKSPDLKDQFLLKQIRSGRGAGIIFGDEVSIEDWLEKLEQLRDPALVPGQTTYIVQPQVKQLVYSMVLGERHELQRNYLVGTYHSIHGQFVGIGMWRSNPGRICALATGGSWMVSVMSPPE
ncbi:hypothetical protein FQN49_007879 [Arthroderma sp. PD_2]|nr:hypothetical protein FQN49_007879 [Arthroderma sp. PD_2]